MTPPLPACKLAEKAAGVDKDKLAKAMAHIEEMTQKERRAKKGSLDAFLAKQPQDVSKMNKEELLATFHMHQTEAQGSYKCSKSSRAIGKSNKKIDRLHWWNREKMDKEIGPICAQHMRDSNLLPVRPHKLTKSVHLDHVEYGCAEDYEELEEHELRELKILADAELSVEDIKAFEDTVDDFGMLTSVPNRRLYKLASNEPMVPKLKN